QRIEVLVGGGLRRRMAIGALAAEDREMELAEFELEIDPVRDFNRIADFFGISAKGSRHLCGRLDVKLIGVEAPASVVGHRLTGLDAEQHLVRLGILAMEIVTIVGGDQREPESASDLTQRIVERSV